MRYSKIDKVEPGPAKYWLRRAASSGESCIGVDSAMSREQLVVVSHSRRDNTLPWHEFREDQTCMSPAQFIKSTRRFQMERRKGGSSARKSIYHAAKYMDLDISQY